MKYTLFLDDERVPSSDLIVTTENLAICRTYDDAVETVLRLGMPEHICFDHDLGEYSRTGHEFAHWLVLYAFRTKPYPEIKYSIHSQNPIGAGNIKGVLDNYHKYKDIL